MSEPISIMIRFYLSIFLIQIMHPPLSFCHRHFYLEFAGCISILFVVIIYCSSMRWSSFTCSCFPLMQAGLPLVQQYLYQFEQLVREHLPKLGEHFTKEMINPSMYASQWFITVFSYSFPFHLALRIWDVFLNEVSSVYSQQSH